MRFSPIACVLLAILAAPLPAAALAQVGEIPAVPFAGTLTTSDSSTAASIPPDAPDTTDTTIGAATADQYQLKPFDMITNLPENWWIWTKETFSVESIPTIVWLGALTGMTIHADYESWQQLKRPYDDSHMFREFSNRGVDMGDGKFQFGIAAAFGLYGFVASDQRALRTASQTVEVILSCGAVVQLLKHITGRESPVVTTTPTGRWKFFPNQIEYHKHVPHYDAFPSGHIATALATLTVVADNYPEATWIKYIGYPAVTLVGVGLVATSIHWWSDIPLGLALGWSFGKLVARRQPPSQASANGQPLRSQSPLLSPHPYLGTLSDGTPSIGLYWIW
ncbi:MAG: phosphatase PAP2 family protein [Chlorobi bacterium CHB2]|nr:phosphatase PAP2 family protein [Chlorobi bacterium CHB2]